MALTERRTRAVPTGKVLRSRAAWSTAATQLDPGTCRIQIPGSIESDFNRGETGVYIERRSLTPITKDVRGGRARGALPQRAGGGATHVPQMSLK